MLFRSHQKFVYVYDPNVMWTFLVELIKILPDDAKISYPRIAKKVDDAPKQYNVMVLPTVVEDDDFDEDDEPIADDAEAYKTHDDDEVSEMEVEEREEEETEEDPDMEDMEPSDFEGHTEED